MLSTNYSKFQWKNLLFTLSLMMIMTALPILAYLHFALVPSINGWEIGLNILGNSIDSQQLKSLLGLLSANEISNLVFAFSVSLIGMILTMMIPIFLMTSYILKLAIWLSKKSHIYPMMNLVIFWNGKKIDEFRFKN